MAEREAPTGDGDAQRVLPAREPVEAEALFLVDFGLEPVAALLAVDVEVLEEGARSRELRFERTDHVLFDVCFGVEFEECCFVGM